MHHRYDYILNNFINKACLNNVLSIISEYDNLDIYIAGGCIRDLIINEHRKIHDFDLFINGSELLIEKFLARLCSVGKLTNGPFGAPRLYFKDTIYWDIVPFYKFVVSNHEIRDINDLLMNFDFTANAIALDIKTRNLINPLNGIKDIESKILRATHFNFPEKNVSDNIKLSTLSVFWFRLVHYQSYLNFKFDNRTMDWIILNKYRINDIELFKKHFFVPKISREIKNLL
ncbi:MAG: CCA tRNA nucleotidyltransferase [Smithella sp.]|jgi:hypothetical protein